MKRDLISLIIMIRAIKETEKNIHELYNRNLMPYLYEEPKEVFNATRWFITMEFVQIANNIWVGFFQATHIVLDIQCFIDAINSFASFVASNFLSRLFFGARLLLIIVLTDPPKFSFPFFVVILFIQII